MGKSNFAKRLKLIAHLRDACPIKWIQFIRGDLSLLHKFIFTSAVIDEDRYDYSICSKCARLTAVFVFTKGLCLPRSLSVALALWIKWHVCEWEWRHNRDLLVFVCRQVVCVRVVSVSWVPLSWRIFCGREYFVVLVLDLRQWQTTGQPQEFAVGSFLLQMHVSGAFSHQETGEEPGFVLFSVYLVSVLSVNIDIRD